MKSFMRTPMCVSPGSDRDQDARDYAEAERNRQANSNRDDANLRGPKAGGGR